MASTWTLSRLLRRKLQYQSPSVTALPSMLKQYSKWAESAGSNGVRGLTLLGAGVSGTLSLVSVAHADEAEHGLACPSYPWRSKDVPSSCDITLAPSDKQIFKHDCASCHTGLSLHRDPVAKTEKDTGIVAAAEIEVIDGQNFEGKAFLFPGKFSTMFPQPYATEKAAKFANPGLSLISKACTTDQNHVSALLNRNCGPAGVLICDGLCKNPYFSSGAIAMPKMPNSCSMDFEDGITLSKAQMRKDVAAILSRAT